MSVASADVEMKREITLEDFSDKTFVSFFLSLISFFDVDFVKVFFLFCRKLEMT